MKNLANIMVAVVAVMHIYFMIVEMFLWSKTYGRKVFGLSQELAEQTRPLAANQGLYNGFLAAGLIWSLFSSIAAFDLKVFFLGCVIVAGVYGGRTVNRKILWVQAIPAALALILLIVS